MAGKIFALISGAFVCSGIGRDNASIVVSGTDAAITNSTNGAKHSETLQFNKTAVYDGIYDANGFLVSRVPTEAVNLAANMLPLSSSLAIAQNPNQTVSICRKAS